jgi:ferredoxin
MEKNGNITQTDPDRRITAFTALPPELHLLIAYFLPFPFNIHLKLTCSYFHTLIPSLSHKELLITERTDYALIHDLYACRYCVRLRPASRFAERMLQRRRSKGARDARKRFCVDCGLMQRGEAEEARYGPGAQMVVQGVSCVLCIVCRRFDIGARDLDGRYISLCRNCFEHRALERIR